MGAGGDGGFGGIGTIPRASQLFLPSCKMLIEFIDFSKLGGGDMGDMGNMGMGGMGGEGDDDVSYHPPTSRLLPQLSITNIIRQDDEDMPELEEDEPAATKGKEAEHETKTETPAASTTSHKIEEVS